jgi:YfiH family protein
MNWIKPDWPAADNVHAAVTLRTGGVSHGAYASLNPALHVYDVTENVMSNRQIIKNMLQLPAEPVWLQQVHGANVVKADQAGELERADASFTDQSNIVCAVLTADCLPLLFSAADGRLVAAVHAGWRGLLTGIIGQTVTAMNSHDLLVWLGPAIGPDCFEVGGEVREAFVTKSADYAPAFRPLQNNKWLANIYCVARINLAQLGIENIYGGHFCTVTDRDRFYSYRRDGETGRMATLIWRD